MRRPASLFFEKSGRPAGGYQASGIRYPGLDIRYHVLVFWNQVLESLLESLLESHEKLNRQLFWLLIPQVPWNQWIQSLHWIIDFMIICCMDCKASMDPQESMESMKSWNHWIQSFHGLHGSHGIQALYGIIWFPWFSIVFISGTSSKSIFSHLSTKYKIDCVYFFTVNINLSVIKTKIENLKMNQSKDKENVCTKGWNWGHYDL